MPDSFKKRFLKQLLIALGVITVIAVIIIVLNIDINKRMTRIEARKRERAMQAEAILILSDLKKESERARAHYPVLESLLPTRDQLISFPRELEQLAKLHTIDLGFSFGSEAASTEDQPGVIRFTMSLGGTLDNLLNFLKAFESHKYFINLASVDLAKREGTRFALGTSGEIFTR
jgi:hypothetical protein